jgi:predicted component of type VI protein secretion system
MKAYLTVTSGRHSGRTIPITTSPFVIGRDPTAQLRPASSAIGDRHCAILTEGGKLVIHDLAHGTRLNDQAIEGAAEVADGDQLQVGPLAFRISVENDAEFDEPEPGPSEPSEDLTEDEVAALLLSPKQKPPREPEDAPAAEPTPADGPRRNDWAKRFEARPLHGGVQMPHTYNITENRPGHVVIHRRAGPRPPAGFREVHPNIESAMQHLRSLYLGYHIKVTDVPAGH